MKPEPIAYRRYWRDGKPVDTKLQPINGASCRSLSRIWVQRLSEGSFSRIEFLMSDETRVVIKAQSECVRVDPKTGEHVWGRLGRRVESPNFGAYPLQTGKGTFFHGPGGSFGIELSRDITVSALFDVDLPLDTLAPGDAA